MKENEIRRGIKSLIQATVKEAERFDAAPERPARQEGEPVPPETITGEREPETAADQVVKEAVAIPVIEVKKGGQITIKTHYYPLPNDVIDRIAFHLEPTEEVLYHRLYRRSWGWGRATCRVSAQALKKQTACSSLTTIRKALRGLIDKRYIIPVMNEKERAYDNQEGTLYRVLLPHEILLGKTHEGVLIRDIPQNGLPESVLSKFNPTIFNRTENDTTQSTPTDLPENDTTQSDISPASPPEAISLDVSKNDRTDFDPHVQTTYKDMCLKTLSHDELIEKFYHHINQPNISQKERVRASEIYTTLRKDGFTEEEIVFAVEWTLTNVKEVRSFSILEHTIGQALSERERILEQRAHEKKGEAEQQEFQRQEEARRAAEEFVERVRQQRREASPWKEVWEQIADYLSQQMPRQSFCTWIQPLFIAGLQDTTVVLDCPSRFIKEYVEKEYRSVIEKAVTTVSGGEKHMSFVCAEEQTFS